MLRRTMARARATRETRELLGKERHRYNHVAAKAAVLRCQHMNKQILLPTIIANVPGQSKPRYPWASMDIGDWFEVDSDRCSYTNIRETVRRINARSDRKFSIDGIGGEGNAVVGKRFTGAKVTRVA